MKRKKVSLKDIGNAIGVSQMTVSRALHGKSGLSEELHRKIVAAAEEMGYMPSRSVQELSLAGNSMTVGVVVPHFGNTIFPEIIENIESFLSANGYRILLCCSYNNPMKEFREISALLERKVDGIIWSPVALDNVEGIVGMIRKQRCPLVFVDRLLEGIQTDAVVVNDQESMFQLVSHLIDLGRKRIAYINARMNSYVSRERLTGYKNALEQAGIAYDPKLILNIGADVAAGKNGVAELFGKSAAIPKPDAVACFNDPLAIGAELELLSHGFAIPDDVAITGFSGTFETEILPIPLTTAKQEAAELGFEAARLLFSRMINPGLRISPVKKVLRTTLLLRASTGVPSGNS